MNIVRFARVHWLIGVLPLVYVISLSPIASVAATVEGHVTQVTLYRQQAQVTRRVPIEGAKGSVEIIVTQLPERIVEGSLFAEGPADVEVRAVRLRTRAVGQEPREEVRQLDEAIQAVNDTIAENESTRERLEKRSQYLDALEGFVAPTAKTELSQGVLDAEALQKITMFNFEQREQIGAQTLQLQKAARQLNNELTLLQRKRAEITGGASRTVREAVLFLEKHNDEPQSIDLNYLVSQCGWSPSYTFRAGKDRREIRAEYSAMIYQLTGEEWRNVRLTLSTASPALAATGPGLAPFHVGLQPMGQEQGKGQLADNISEQFRMFRNEQYAANTMNRQTISLRGNIDSSWGINSAACKINLLELTNGKEVLSTLELASVGAGDEPSLSYELDSTVSLASRSDQQMVRIMQTTLKSQFYHVATPVLTSYVYREAELKNASNQDLLAGPITVYLDGRFVGRSEIPTVARGQAFVVGFGADPQLRVRRELASKADSVQGGNRELSITYRLVAENYKSEAVSVRLFDRLPYSNRSADVRVTLGAMDDELSQDKLYLRRERPKGILRWEVEVPPSATADEARIVQYGYTVEYDRNFELTALGGELQRLQQEFEELQRGRVVR